MLVAVRKRAYGLGEAIEAVRDTPPFGKRRVEKLRGFSLAV